MTEVSIDAAVLEAIHSPPLALGVESCDCPPEYAGTSCQNPNRGYYRWFDSNVTISTVIGIERIGRAKPCQCNDRSDVCDIESGHCLVRKKRCNSNLMSFYLNIFLQYYMQNCTENTSGPDCNVCAESFFGDPDYGGCRSCPCPQKDKKFSNTCVVRSDNEVICVCKPGNKTDKWLNMIEI